MEANISMIFEAFSSTAIGIGDGYMDGRQFTKMAKDSKILGKKITTTDMDIIFAKVKDKGSRKINETQFVSALQLLAAKKSISLDQFVDQIVDAGGPKFRGTRADHVELHDNRETYTGVYANGGPTTVDSVHVPDLSGLVDRTDGLHLDDSGPNPASHKKSPKAKLVTSGQPAATLQEVFFSFTNGAADMDGRQLVKLTKDTKILNKKLTTTDVDIDFSKVKRKGARKITFAEFSKLIRMWAPKRGMSEDELINHILARGGPSFRGTKTDSVRLHDDMDGYTGVYARGGPSTIGGGRADDLGRINDLSQLADRSIANVRGVKQC